MCNSKLYIRVKDGVYGPLDCSDFILKKGTFFGDKILKQSKELEDLFDEYRAVKKEIKSVNDYEPCFTASSGLKFLFDLFEIYEQDRNNYNIYAGIWTPGGMKYVAKLNEKDNWELL